MRHHFVPQFLLGAWSAGANDQKLQEFRLDLKGFPAFRRVPKATAYQDNLYALTKPVIAGMTQQAVETHLLRHIDNDAARVRIRLVQQGLKSLSLGERSEWVRFIMSLRVRQPHIISKLRIEGAEHLRQSLSIQPEQYKALVEDGDAPTLRTLQAIIATHLACCVDGWCSSIQDGTHRP